MPPTIRTSRCHCLCVIVGVTGAAIASYSSANPNLGRGYSGDFLPRRNSEPQNPLGCSVGGGTGGCCSGWAGVSPGGVAACWIGLGFVVAPSLTEVPVMKPSPVLLLSRIEMYAPEVSGPAPP